MDYQKSWDAMNDLEMAVSKICSAREILDCAIEKLSEMDTSKTETLMYAVDDFLQLFMKEFDQKFKVAWNEVIVKQKDDIDYLANDFLTNNFPNENKTKNWVLPVEADQSGEYFITFPDDLLEAAGLEEDDKIEWFDNGDGSYVLKKATNPETGITTSLDSANTI